MGFAFLLLGLVPLMFLPHMADPASDDADSDTTSHENDENGDLLDDATANVVDPPIPDAVDLLKPVDSDDQPDEGLQTVDPDTVLQAVDTDDPGGQNSVVDGEVLKPVDQIETEADTVFIDASTDAGLDYSEIENFETGIDILHVSIAPELVVGELDVEVTPTDDGLDALVFVEEQLVAILKGAPDASLDDVVVEIERLVA